MTAAGAAFGTRMSLDRLVERMADPAFATLYRRQPNLRERDGHVSPSALAVAPPRSRYVGRWRKHARRCPDCATAFRYFGLRID